MPRDFMMIGLIIWTFLTSFNYIYIKNYLIGGVYFCYAIANVLMLIIGRR